MAGLIDSPCTISLAGYLISRVLNRDEACKSGLFPLRESQAKVAELADAQDLGCNSTPLLPYPSITYNRFFNGLERSLELFSASFSLRIFPQD